MEGNQEGLRMTTRRIHRFVAPLALVALMFVALMQVQAQSRNTSNRYSAARTAYLEAPATQAELEMVRSKSISALNFMATYWSRVFSESGRRFTPPRVMVNYQTLAHYDPRTNTINFNPLFFVQQMRFAAEEFNTDGDMAFIVILAHEYGHAVQAQLNIMRGPSIAVELQADSLAGALTRAASQAGLLDPGDEDEAVSALLSGRDATGTSPYHPNAHGTGRQRVAAFNRGFEGGVSAALR
jgi:predicted metalloprotease